MAVQFTATSDVNQVLADWDRLRNKNEQLVQKLAAVTKESGQVEKAQRSAMQELSRFAESTKRAVREPAEEMRMQLSKLDDAKKAGLLTDAEHAKALDATKQKMAALSPEYQQRLRDEQELARFAEHTAAVVETAGEKQQATLGKLKRARDAGLLTEQQYAKAVEKANKDAAGSYDILATKVEKTSGVTGQLKSEIAGAMAGYMTFQGVLAKVGEALQFVQQETEKAKSSFAGMADPRRKLAQIADPAAGMGLDQLEARVDELAQKYGESREKMANVLFTGVSEGFVGDVESIAKYGDIVDAEAAAGVAGQVPGLFKGSGLTGTEAVDVTLLAAKQSRLNFEQIAQALPAIAEGGSMAGASPTEAMGVLSFMAGQFGSGQTAADRFKGLATKAAITPGFEGLGMVGTVERLQGMSPESRKEFLGSGQELNVAYAKLSQNLPEVKKRIAELDTELQTLRGGGQGILETQYQQFFDTGSDQGRRRMALEQQKQAEVYREIANERQFAESGMTAAAKRDEQLGAMKEQGQVGLAQFSLWEAHGAAGLLQAGKTETGLYTGALQSAVGAESYGAMAMQGLQFGGTGGRSMLTKVFGDAIRDGFNDVRNALAARGSDESIELQRESTAATREQTSALRQVYERLPKSGGSAAASGALATAQRQGR